MFYNEIELKLLEEKVKARMSARRFSHTLGVSDAAVRIGEILLPSRISELRVAALLHDITKECSLDEHISLCKEFNIPLSDEDLAVKDALHSYSGAAMIIRDFPSYTSEAILTAVKEHTLGSPDMSLFSKIIFISDYVEDGRTAKSCITVRDFLFSRLSKENSEALNIQILNDSIVMAIEFTASYLDSQKRQLHSLSLLTKNAIKGLI